MDAKKIQIIKFGGVALLVFISFIVCYYSFLRAYSLNSENAAVKQDQLSGEVYGYIYNERNPYGSRIIGFDEMRDAGVTNDDWIYISDVLTNFTMYHERVFSGKISYVSDSFKRIDRSGLYTTYSFKFGINDGNIKTVKVKSSWVEENIQITIRGQNNKVEFDKKFTIYS